MGSMVLVVSACSSPDVERTQTADKGKSCFEVEDDLLALDDLEQDIGERPDITDRRDELNRLYERKNCL